MTITLLLSENINTHVSHAVKHTVCTYVHGYMFKNKYKKNYQTSRHLTDSTFRKIKSSLKFLTCNTIVRRYFSDKALGNVVVESLTSQEPTVMNQRRLRLEHVFNNGGQILSDFTC